MSEDKPVMKWSEVQALPMPAPADKIAYGKGLQQFGELRLPAGKGPFPVVLLIHGGCWLNAFDYSYITRLGAALTELGAATWTIEYRRLGDEGGGWPGTFLDVAQAADHLRELAKTQPLDLSRVAAMGHSAGGHLALWLAVRGKLPKDSALFSKNPQAIQAVIGLAAITDLKTYRIGAPGSCNASVDQLMGGTNAEQPARYAQASPRALLPLGVKQWLVQGARDPIVSLDSVRAYAHAARVAGDKVQLLETAAAGHFETSVPLGNTWLDLQHAVREALGL